MIKQILLTVFSSTLLYSTSAQTPDFDNPSMEEWLSVSGALSLERPTNFHGSDSTLRGIAPMLMIAGYPITPKKQISKSTDAYEGDFAARIVTLNLGTTFGNTPGILANGPIEVDMSAAGSIDDGIGITDILKVSGGTPTLGRKVDSVVAYIKSPVTNTDSAIVFINAKRNIGGTMNIIGSGSTIIEPGADYQRIVISMEYITESMIATDSLTIMFVSSFTTATPTGTTPIFNFTENNEILVDKVALYTSVATGINNPYQTQDLGIIAYPIPASQQIHFNNTNNIPHNLLAIYDMQGRILLQKSLQTGINTIDIQHWPAGNYMYEVIDTKAQAKQTGKFTK